MEIVECRSCSCSSEWCVRCGLSSCHSLLVMLFHNFHFEGLVILIVF